MAYAIEQIDQLRERDGDCCWICGVIIDFRIAFSWKGPEGPTRDHVIRHRDGGSNDLANLKLAHRCCNTERD